MLLRSEQEIDTSKWGPNWRQDLGLEGLNVEQTEKLFLDTIRDLMGRPVQ